MKKIQYKITNLKKMDLKSLYDGSSLMYDLLDQNLINIIDTEAPITFNMVKKRLRDAFEIGKISENLLNIINDRINKLGFKSTDNFYDITYWPKEGIFNVDYLRVGYQRQIYDIPFEEMKNLVKELNLSGEQLYRSILKEFGYEVLTQKALDYLQFIERKYEKA